MTNNELFTTSPLTAALRDVQRLIRFTTRTQVRKAGVRPGSEGFTEVVRVAKQSTTQRALDTLTPDEQEAVTAALGKIIEALGGEEALAQARERGGEDKRRGRRHGRGHGHGHQRGHRGGCRHELTHGEAHHSVEHHTLSARRTQAAFERGFAAGYTRGARA